MIHMIREESLTTPAFSSAINFQELPPLALARTLPTRATEMVLAWAAIHRSELHTAWNELRAGRIPAKIAPLE